MIEFWKKINSDENRLYQVMFYDGTNVEEAEDFLGTVGLKKGSAGDLKYKSGMIMAGKDTWLVSDKSGDVVSFSDLSELHKKFRPVHLFSKEDRSSFKYWFAHWCAYQMTALNLGKWKFKYLFHDFEKPWFKLVMSYKKLQSWHRLHNRHHLEYGLKKGWDKIDVRALVIDWECCRFSKINAPLDARQTLEYEVARDKWKQYEKEIRSIIEPVLEEFGL